MFRFFFLVLIALGVSCCDRNVSFTYPTKLIPNSKQIIKEFDRTYVNHYQNLENPKKDTTKKWYSYQDSLAESYFVAKKLREYQNGIDAMFPKGSSTAYMYKPLATNNEYFYLDSVDDSTYVKRTNLRTGTISTIYQFDEATAIHHYAPSGDAKKFFAIVSQAGKDRILVIDVESGKILTSIENHINATALAWAVWTKDDSHIAYTAFPNLEDSKNSYIGLLNMANHETSKIFVNGIDNVRYNPEFFVVPEVSSKESEYLIAYVANASEHYSAYYLNKNDIDGNYRWKNLFKEKDSVIYYGIERDGEYFYTRYHEGNHVLAKSKMGAVADVEEVIFQKPEDLNFGDFKVTKNNIYLTLNRNGIDAKLLSLKKNFEVDTVQLNYPVGQISFYESNPSHTNLLVSTESWTTNTSVYNISDWLEITKSDEISQYTPEQFDEITYSIVQVSSFDEVKVPLTIIHKKDFDPKGENKAVIMAYGAYGLSRTPEFQSSVLDFVSKGNIYAIAHVRGGGEKGYEWYLDGIKDKKSNSWKDLLASAEFLKSNNYFSGNSLGLFFQSAGGITAGMALMENTEMFGAVVGIAPFFNPIRIEYHDRYNASDRFYDFGSISNKKGFENLLNMDPTVNFKENVTYPPSLMIIGDKDDLVPLYDPAKYIALLQAGDPITKTPYLLDIYKDTGHHVPYGEVHDKAFLFFKENL